MTLCPTQTPDLSVIIPAYNEARRLPLFLQRVIAHLAQRGQPYEILVVDDGSQDQTAQAVTLAAHTCPSVRLIQLTCNMGKGAAVRRGMQAARGTIQLFADADGATPIEELERLEAALGAGADLAIGSRALASHNPAFTVHARWHRSVLGSLFNNVVRQLGVHHIADTQCGFKLFRQSVAQDLFAVSCVDGYAFDLELLYIAHQRRYRIAEVPINWTDQPGSKVRPWRDGSLMLRELVAIRKRDAQGLYQPRCQPTSGGIEPALATVEPTHS
ncbi:MAG: glycosyltransferase [Nitrospira sp. CR1.1]|nr:glycosyltransferase [Nitrospira sp. CR1.1]